jgi:hypothetical protein
MMESLEKFEENKNSAEEHKENMHKLENEKKDYEADK